MNVCNTFLSAFPEFGRISIKHCHCTKAQSLLQSSYRLGGPTQKLSNSLWTTDSLECHSKTKFYLTLV